MEKIQLTKSQKILFAVLGVVLAFAIFDIIKNKDTYVSFYSGKKTATNANAQKEKNKKNADMEDPLKISLTTRWGRDPFYIPPKVVAKKRLRKVRKEPILNLKGISFRAEGAVALINDRIVKAGDVIGKYKVIKIEKKRVILWDGKKRKILELSNI